jgi:hypothetical protein
MIRAALGPKYPEYAKRMVSYTEAEWARFTWEVLSHGIQRNERFIAWPDTRRLWRKHLGEAKVQMLDAHLPPKLHTKAKATA